MKGHHQKAFTLIELLIVIAIILILIAIALPNFLSAQIRARVANLEGGMRSTATAIESFRIDYGFYPPDGRWQMGLQPWVDDQVKSPPPSFDETNYWLMKDHVWLTTPIAYLTEVPGDPFTLGAIEMFPGDTGYYENTSIYENIENSAREMGNVHLSNVNLYTLGELETLAGKKRVLWSIASFGPDKDKDAPDLWVEYSPTNGTTSSGDIFRTGP